MIDTDKYEPTQIETLLHNTRAHSPDGWRKLSKSLFELSDDDRLLIEYAPKLLAEVKRLREAIADIATNMEAADASYMGGFIEDLWKVIE
jgi:hypothetical protein